MFFSGKMSYDLNTYFPSILGMSMKIEEELQQQEQQPTFQSKFWCPIAVSSVQCKVLLTKSCDGLFL